MQKLFAITVLSCTAVLAQDNGDKITVPLDDPSKPARIHAEMISGGITVHGGDVRNVIVEVSSRGEGRRQSREHRRSSDKAEGMKRLELPGNSGLEITEQDNLVNIKKAPWESSSTIVVTVPRRSSVHLKCLNDGDIQVEGIEGEIDANDLNGNISLKNVAGSVLAHSLNGEVVVTLDRIDSSKPMSFSTMNGDIDVTLPGSLKANVVLKTDHGEIYSDFEVKLSGSSLKPSESGRQSDGSYRLRFDRALRGTVAGGGPEFQFTSFNGQIYLRKKK